MKNGKTVNLPFFLLTDVLTFRVNISIIYVVASRGLYEKIRIIFK